jgi:hypothetical protein
LTTPAKYIGIQLQMWKICLPTWGWREMIAKDTARMRVKTMKNVLS